MSEDKKEVIELIKEEHKELDNDSLMEMLAEKESKAKELAKKGEYDTGSLLGDIISLHHLAVERQLKTND